VACRVDVIDPARSFSSTRATGLRLCYNIPVPLLEIANLDFAYGRTPVLRDINLTADEGSTLGVIGNNGGGKTTLLRLILGLRQPQRGTIRIGGYSPREAARRGDVFGYVPQNPAAPENFPISVRDVARLGLVGKTGLFRSPAATDLAFVDSLLERLGLASLHDAPVGSLSGGQLQRVYIARALACRPKLLVLDEPTTGVDRRGQQEFLQLLAELKREMNLTVIFVSHDLRAVTSMCDRIACLNVTLHYHDAPQHLPSDLVYRMFSCDLEAIGIGTMCNHPEHMTGKPVALNR
jgi:zinc transport system ATP-binding protein